MTNALYRNDRPATYPASYYAQGVNFGPERAALHGEQRADVCVIGAGYTGLWAAKTLAEKGLRVIVLEAHRAGFGASGRNGGQVRSGFNKSPRWIAQRLGKDNARAMWDFAQEGKAMVRDFCLSHAPKAQFKSGVADVAYTAPDVRALHDEADFLRLEYGYDLIEKHSNDSFQAIVKSPLYHGGIVDMGAGHLHPLHYALALVDAAESAGAIIHERSEVHDIESGQPALVRTGQGRVLADSVIIAGNGYLPHLFPKVASRVLPINSFMIATAPLGARATDVLARDIAVADNKHVVNYFRLSDDGRLLFGGRANASIGFPRDIAGLLRGRMEHMFPQLRGVRVDHAWGGALGITTTRLPCLLRLAPNMVAAGGFSGHGVALSGLAGRVMAEAVAGQTARFDTLSTLPTPRFPGGPMMRTPMLAAALTWFGLRDKLGL